MTRLLMAFVLLPLIASAADDPRFAYLEQEVRNLQRQVQVLSRQLDELRPRVPRAEPRSPRAAASPADPQAQTILPQWVDAGLWRGLRPGMSELEVINALGAPTSMREERGARVLLYAMEIGSSGFLGGSVKLRERAVVEILRPTLQ